MTDKALKTAHQQIEHATQNIAQIRSFFDPATFTVTYAVYDMQTKCAAIIDSVLDYDPASGKTSSTSADAVINFIEENDLTVEWLLETHAHADHLSAAPYLKEKIGGKIAIGEHITKVQHVFGGIFNAGDEFHRDGSDFDHLFADGDHFKLGNLDVTIMHVPGHTPACIAYVIGDAIFVGDTMFMPDYGTARADFPGGDARTLFQSARRILQLPPQTRIFLCHDYLPEGRDEYIWETSVAEERQNNIHIHDGISEDDFVAMRTKRDKGLNVPRLLLPSVQVNMRAGHLPPAEDNGKRYLKIPLDAS